MEKNRYIKRACIYFVYDGEGIVDDYILNQMKDMRQNVEFLHCVVNGTLTEKSRAAVQQCVDELYERENTGYDIGAYKAAIAYIGWDKLQQYDELVLMNYTCFGPVYPFREVFDWAQKQDVDFWGLTWDTKMVWDEKEYLHYNNCKYFYNSYFLALRKPLFGSGFLKEFFDEFPIINSYIESGQTYEYAFPGYFTEHGYRGAIYCDDTDKNYPLLHNPAYLMEKYRMPLFKVRSFFHHYTDALALTAGEATAKLIDYVQTKTDYDMNLVWDSILRAKSLSDIVRCAQLNRVLPNDIAYKNETKLRVGAIYYAACSEHFDEAVKYLAYFPDTVDILVITALENKTTVEKKIEEAQLPAELLLADNRGSDKSALLIGGADFVTRHDLICFAHDIRPQKSELDSVGRSWSYKLFENVFGSRAYIENIIAMFDEEKRLGIAFPSAPNHGNYAYGLGTGWCGNFANTEALLNEFGVKSKIDERTLCVCPLGGCFWFRADALKKLFAGLHGDGWHYEDFPAESNQNDATLLQAIERSYAYFAQSMGYYPVYIYNSRYARIELTNLEFVKTGSSEMRGWMNEIVAHAIGFGGGANSEAPVNYGIRRSLINLAYAIRCKYPRFWGILLPIRRIGQKILKIKTR